MRFNIFAEGYGSIDMGAMMGVLVLSIIPIIVFYMFCQKYIIEGVVAGAVKRLREPFSKSFADDKIKTASDSFLSVQAVFVICWEINYGMEKKENVSYSGGG